MECKPVHSHNLWIAILLLAGLVLPLYTNSFSVPWHLDDLANIVNNPALHISYLAPQTLWKTFFSDPVNPQKLYRPLPCLSFAVNLYVGGTNTFGFHLVNLMFHLFTALALYSLCVRLLSVLYDQKSSEKFDYIHSSALLGAAVWAIHPIQTEAITYIVQRMAVMAAFFYVLGMLYFMKSRTASTPSKRWMYAGFVVFWYLCGAGSKENAIMLPFSLILIEWIFFQKGKLGLLCHPKNLIIAVGIIIAVLITAVILKNGLSVEFINRWYENRPFTLTERLLTEPRVVLDYLSQIFYPLPEKFSVAHDVTVSSSLLHPWTTLPAIIILAGMIAGAAFFPSRYPLISFAILFFLINHVVESSILPLELVFEHRNYLPSLFLFLPIAVGLNKLLNSLHHGNRLIRIILATSVIIMVVGVGLTTYMRNAVWESDIRLWTDALRKAPNSIRPLVTLGIKYGWKENPSPSDYRYALAFFRKALEQPQTARKTETAEIYGNIGSIYFKQGDYQKAISAYREGLKINSDFLKNRFDLIKPLILTGHFKEAESHAKYLVEKKPENPRYQNILGFILLWQKQPHQAIGHLQSALKNGLTSANLFTNIGVTLTRLGSFENGRWFLKIAFQKSGGDIFPLFALIENRSKAGDSERAIFYSKQIIDHFSIESVFSHLKSLKTNYRKAPLSVDLIVPIIHKTFQSGLVRMRLALHS